MKKICIVEDDENVAKELCELLNNANYEGYILKDFKHTKEEILKSNSDLVLLDINIPYANGEVVLKELRKESNIPVIMVTSKNTDIDEVLSMSYGADDYIAKPYNPTILLLHISSILRRCEVTSDLLSYKDLKIYLSKAIIKKDDEELFLTKNEMIIFTYLVNNKERIVTRDELMTSLWNNDEFINDNALTVNISRLRSKLASIGYEDCIKTMKGLGYILL